MLSLSYVVVVAVAVVVAAVVVVGCCCYRHSHLFYSSPLSLCCSLPSPPRSCSRSFTYVAPPLRLIRTLSFTRALLHPSFTPSNPCTRLKLSLPPSHIGTTQKHCTSRLLLLASPHPPDHTTDPLPLCAPRQDRDAHLAPRRPRAGRRSAGWCRRKGGVGGGEAEGSVRVGGARRGLSASC